jgi:hypothetical protein
MSSDLFQKFPAGEEAVERLAPLPHDLDFEACRQVYEMNGCRGFIDVLSAGAGRTDERLNKIALGNAEHGHPVFEELLLHVADGKSDHFGLFSVA